MIPGVDVAVLLVRGRVEVPGAPPDQDLGRPAVAVGRISLDVASTRKQIALTLKPERAELAPKDTLRLEIQARDPDGAPQKAAVAVMVVDEGVLSLMAYKTPDPLAFFHHDREAGVGLFDLRTSSCSRAPRPTSARRPTRTTRATSRRSGTLISRRTAARSRSATTTPTCGAG
jgi:uncharacterized protein YfaS (alpha-2-macroglobulin family)